VSSWVQGRGTVIATNQASGGGRVLYRGRRKARWQDGEAGDAEGRVEGGHAAGTGKWECAQGGNTVTLKV